LLEALLLLFNKGGFLVSIDGTPLEMSFSRHTGLYSVKPSIPKVDIILYDDHAAATLLSALYSPNTTLSYHPASQRASEKIERLLGQPIHFIMTCELFEEQEQSKHSSAITR
jgi:hypothetical protein